MRTVFMENKRELNFSGFGKQKMSEKLYLVHTDVQGLTQVQYLGGYHYYVTFIDYATRKTQVYCIRQKFDVFATFKKWEALVQNETWK